MGKYRQNYFLKNKKINIYERPGSLCVIRKVGTNTFFFLLVYRFKKKVAVKVGLQVSLDVNVAGEPPPTITWTFKDNVGYVCLSDNLGPI